MLPMPEDTATMDAAPPATGSMPCPKCGCLLRLTAEEPEDATEMPEADTEMPEAPRAKSFQDPSLKWE